MRALRVFFVLVFGLAMVGPEAHHCPVHDQHAPAPAHHQTSGEHQQQSQHLCTCPQACCPVSVAVTLPQPIVSWTLTPSATLVVVAESPSAVDLAPRKHLQPLAHAPPIARV